MTQSCAEELKRLFKVASPERRLIYKVAVLTGLRRGELASIRVCDVVLDAPTPHFVLRAENAKNRESAQLPVRADLARDIAFWIKERLRAVQEQARRSGEPIPVSLPAEDCVFDVPPRFSVLFNADLARAKVEKRDQRGHVVDFHALRTTFASHLVAGGVPLRTAQSALRHSDPALTANVYTDPALLDVAGALDALPELSLENTNDVSTAATGTHEASGFATEFATDPAEEFATRFAMDTDLRCPSQSSVGTSGGDSADADGSSQVPVSATDDATSPPQATPDPASELAAEAPEKLPA